MDRDGRDIGNRKQRRAAAKQAGGPAKPARASIADLFAAARQHHGAGRLRDAEALYRQALALDPAHVPSLHLLGVLAYQIGRHDAAVELIGKAIALHGGDPAFHSNLGLALQELGRLDEAVASYGRALSLAPSDAELHSNLGNALQEQGRLDEAVASYSRALTIDPSLAVVHNNLGNVLKDRGELGAAVRAYERALALQPDYAEARSNLGLALQEQGRLQEAVVRTREALALRPDHAAIRSNLLFALNYGGDYAPDECLAEARAYGRLVASKVGTRFSSWRCDAQPARLRVGLVSGDLRRHPVGYFLDSVLAELDPARIEIFAYPTQAQADDLSTQLRGRCAAWKPLVGQSDEIAARAIHADGVHVLIDLAGHTARNRLPVFGWKPAPVQAAWLGYFATTGVSEIDYVIGDPHVVPAAEAENFTETAWHLPDSYRCFTPPDVALDVGSLPALAGAGVTFGCFNNLAKMTDRAVSVWARVLHGVAGSRLFLKAKQLDDPAVRQITLDRFAAQDIPSDRLILEGPSSRAAMLADYHRVDIALDPFPYPGGTVSVEALWMGVPVVMRRGDSFLSHGGESIACNVGLADWISESDDAYVAKAIAATAGLERLATLRAGLRQRLLASPMCDAPRFARNLEVALWEMWRRRAGVTP